MLESWITSNGAVVLLAIRPRWADVILSGKKTVEFRRRSFKRDVRYIVIYSTAPVASVIGSFEVEDIVKGSPAELWAQYHQEGAIPKDFFFRYYGDRVYGVAIKIGRVWRFDPPIELCEIGDGLKPPQSFTYLLPHEIDRLPAGIACRK